MQALQAVPVLLVVLAGVSLLLPVVGCEPYRCPVGMMVFQIPVRLEWPVLVRSPVLLCRFLVQRYLVLVPVLVQVLVRSPVLLRRFLAQISGILFYC